MGSRSAGAGLLLGLAFPGVATPQPTMLSPAYAAAVERYVAGDREGALAGVAAIAERELREQVEALRSLGKRARACTACAASVAWQQAPLRAALMLHTDAALDGSRDRTSARTQESLAIELAALMKDDPERGPFARRWYATMAGLAQAGNRWSEALDWVERGLDAFPGSADLLLVLGAIEETYGAEVTPRWFEEIMDPNPRQAQANLARAQELRGHLQKALRALRDAVAAMPSLHEARLRLGRVAWRLGDTDEARAALSEVLAASTLRETVFLAHLFLGRIHEDADRLDEATRSYEAAVALQPRCQSARFALSHLLWRRGDAAGARRGVEVALQAAGETQQRDPFWRYPWGSGVGASERLEALRQEASP